VRRLPALVVSASLAVAGCDLDGQETNPRPSPGAGERRVVREWIGALNRGDYQAAASYFAEGAIVDQGRPFKLRDAAAARLFNASLPCRARLIEVEDERGPKALASFILSAGPGGPCDGRVQVRVTVHGGRFTEWRQLPEAPEPDGPVV
jgi:hypothetical protein